MYIRVKIKPGAAIFNQGDEGKLLHYLSNEPV